jgi:predicted lipid-binding transport protein (Tim44 family)
MSTTPPQFGTAEYKSTTGGETCRACNQPITGEYYRVNGIQACAGCAEKVKQQAPKDTHAAFVRGMLFGVGGAIAGLIVYSAFGIITGIVIGYVSLAVGWLVAKAIKAGSKGIGGRRYQVAAVVLTYAAVSLSAIPMGIAQILKDKKDKIVTSQQPAQNAPTENDAAGSESSAGTGSAPAAGAPTAKPRMSFGAAIGALLVAGLASPFLELADEPGGIIGLIILLVGMNIAWKMTAAPKLEILGPFKASAPAPAAG